MTEKQLMLAAGILALYYFTQSPKPAMASQRPPTPVAAPKPSPPPKPRTKREKVESAYGVSFGGEIGGVKFNASF